LIERASYEVKYHDVCHGVLFLADVWKSLEVEDHDVDTALQLPQKNAAHTQHTCKA